MLFEDIRWRPRIVQIIFSYHGLRDYAIWKPCLQKLMRCKWANPWYNGDHLSEASRRPDGRGGKSMRKEHREHGEDADGGRQRADHEDDEDGELSKSRQGRRARAAEQARDSLVDLSHRIHAHPELGYRGGAGRGLAGRDARPTPASRSRRASATCRRRSWRGRARARCTSPSAPSTTRCPAIGHACGHNMIAAMAVGAGIAARARGRRGGADGQRHRHAGRGGRQRGGKILLLERGAFAGIHAAMMVHPAPADVAAPHMIAGRDVRGRTTPARRRTPPPSRSWASTPPTR